MTEPAEANDLPEFDWKSPQYQADPVGVLREAARAGDLARSPLGYAVFSRERARPVLKEDLPVSLFHIPADVSPYLAERTRTPLLTRHGPEHRRLRSMLTRVMRGQVIDTLRPTIRAVFDQLLDPLLAAGAADLVPELFDRYPARVLGPLLGVPAEDTDMVAAWVSASARWTNLLTPPEAFAGIEAAWRELEAYLLALFARRRGALGTDIFSELIREMPEAEEIEVVGIAQELTRAGLDTTRRQLACTMYALLQHPAEWRRLQDDPAMAPNVVEEGMRYASIMHLVSRQAVSDTSIAGVAAPAGTVFSVMPVIANRDPAVYDAPDRFDASRSPCPHLTFGAGSHACVGAPLARMEMVEAFSSLAARVGEITLTGPVARSPVHEGWVPRSLPVRLRAR